MLLEYSYDNGMKVLDLLKQNKIVTLIIHEQLDTLMIEYTLISDYPEAKQNRIRKVLENSMAKRFSLITLLDSFIITKSEGKNTRLKLSFNALHFPIAELTYWLTGHPLIVEQMHDNYSDMRQALERVEKLSIELGIINTPLGNVFRKEGTGRNKKQIPLTVNDFIHVMREAVDN